jgi:hypothetical protein
MLGTLWQLEGLQVWEKVRGKGKSPTRREINYHEKSRLSEERPTKKLSAITGRRTTAAGAKDHRWRAMPKNISGCWAVFIGG